MRRILFALLLVALGIAPALAVDFEFDWPQTNTDGTNLTDLAGARIYTCPTTPCTKANGTKLGADIPAPAADPAAGAIGTFSITAGKGFTFVTAFDTANNESGESNVVPFDAVAPSTPTLRKK